MIIGNRALGGDRRQDNGAGLFGYVRSDRTCVAGAATQYDDRVLSGSQPGTCCRDLIRRCQRFRCQLAWLPAVAGGLLENVEWNLQVDRPGPRGCMRWNRARI